MRCLPMKNKVAKLIEILPWLSLNPGVSAKQAASHFEITEKQLIDLLQLAVFTGPGQFGGELVDIDFEDEDSLFVSDAKGLSRPIRFTKMQSLQIVSGLHYLLQLPGLIDNESLTSLLGKFMDALSIEDLPLEVVLDENIEKIASSLGVAISQNKSVRITYSSSTTGVLSSRLIDPKSLTIDKNVRYVQAYCHQALAMRVFRLDRILDCEIESKEQVSLDTMPLSDGTDLIVQLEVTKQALLEIDQSLIVEQRQLVEGNYQISMRVHELNWIAREVLASLGQIRAIGPSELTELIESKVIKWHQFNKVD